MFNLVMQTIDCHKPVQLSYVKVATRLGNGNEQPNVMPRSCQDKLTMQQAQAHDPTYKIHEIKSATAKTYEILGVMFTLIYHSEVVSNIFPLYGNVPMYTHRHNILGPA